jgi:cytochrome d ubiquinol oxidase subunit II
MEPSNLAMFWAGVLACSILLYVILDGFDLGVGVLFGMTRSEAHRVGMMNAIAPFWDGNETWLVVIGAGLFAAFPDVYAVFPWRVLFPCPAAAVRPHLPWDCVRVPLPQ